MYREPELLDFLKGSNWLKVWVPKQQILRCLKRHIITKTEMVKMVRKMRELEEVENKIRNVRSLVDKIRLKEYVKKTAP